MLILPLDELRARARRVRLVLTDVDGTLTDAGVYYSKDGEELKRFSLRDGMGVELLAKAGIATAFITREDSDIVRARAKKLRVEHCVTAHDKLAALPDLEAKTGISRGETAFVGDDVNDVALLEAIGGAGGIAAAPGDATADAKRVAHVITNASGGHGCFRELADTLLSWRSAES